MFVFESQSLIGQWLYLYRHALLCNRDSNVYTMYGSENLIGKSEQKLKQNVKGIEMFLRVSLRFSDRFSSVNLYAWSKVDALQRNCPALPTQLLPSPA